VLSIALVGPCSRSRSTSVDSAARSGDAARADRSAHRLGNHRHFHERLQRELLRAEEERIPLTLCFVDIDDFKKINDRFGHPSGDRVLVAGRGRLRQGGEAFRLGGDEFALLLRRPRRGAALVAASSIVERIAVLDLDHIGT
jgi:diguanylate cyclase (GGDEF)-like protein